MKKFLLPLFIIGILAAGAWAVKRFVLDARNDVAIVAPASPTSTPPPTQSPTPVIAIKELPITLPMIDALFFIDLQFATELKSKMQLTDEQISQLRQLVREETTSLQEGASDAETATTTAAGEKAA